MELQLHSATRDNWIDQALSDLPSILLDHAHCEKKAASTAINFLFRYPEHAQMMKPLSELAREELRHFEQVLEVMKRRGVNFVRQVPSTYASKLVSICRKGEPERMLDLFICSALIEARSCERMRLLAAALKENEPKLAQFYRGLLACEARHYRIYIDMITSVFPLQTVNERFAIVADHEASVLESEGELVRLHS